MSTVRQVNGRLIVELSPEEAQMLQSGDIVKVTKVEAGTVSQRVKDATAEALQLYAQDLNYLEDR